MENVENYIQCYNDYKKGNYAYGTVTSIEDIKNAIKNKKRFVFTRGGARIEIIISLITISIGLIITLGLYAFFGNLFTYSLYSFLISLLPIFVFGLCGSRFLFPGLFKLRSNFIILGAEGIVYKLLTGDVKNFNWNDVSMDIMEKTVEISRTKHLIHFEEIYLSMPNGVLLKSGDYTSKEFPKRFTGKQRGTLVFSTILYYYNYFKLGLLEPSKGELYGE
ncbi:MAG: hypothetical protein ACFFA7_14990 [Promethearchaeota archaeon]